MARTNDASTGNDVEAFTPLKKSRKMKCDQGQAMSCLFFLCDFAANRKRMDEQSSLANNAAREYMSDESSRSSGGDMTPPGLELNQS
jgi:hypothetical protein